MKIEDLRDRVMYLAGSLDEANRNYKKAVEELDAIVKEQTRTSDTPQPPKAD